MFENLSARLSGVVKTLSGNARLTESNIKDALREIRIALLEADVALPVVKQFVDTIREEALGEKVVGSLTPGQALVGVVNDKLTELMGGFNDKLNLSAVPPAIILMAGLQGAGKTTTVGKLAKRLKEAEKKKVLVVSCDVYRPAAIEQLKTLAKSLDIECFPSSVEEKPEAIALAAVDYAKKHYFDVLLVDTAGRLTIDEYMMQEIKNLHQTLNPVETLFVVDAMLGQDAVNTAKAFNDTLNLTGVILTKMDGDARGGAALSIRQVTGKPIKFIGVSEKVAGLEPFYPDRMASRILGMGDILSLIEEVQGNVDEVEAKKLMEKVKKGKGFDLNDFKMQFEQMNNMGGMGKILDKLPGNIAEKAPQVINDKMIKKNVAIIDSMTSEERRKPDLLKASRKRRIALGSGTSVQEVNQLLKQYEQVSQMMKKFSGGGIFKMMKNFKHLMPKM
ncbi:signal recognition particle protein [Aquella oligotrophica]|jgi:signal recognition particle subunit SRP54|uniref:Signal recognition particle protein n=1 Tax=Aquella oligotrophica TaxID=2067065 RepID=A0A2I7N9T5_9NEIS|nr:signal recognition particle protein [Aquella oligotrophica]AUR52995.1 signal recognition particle protein [Aquella oligotrophica]